MFRKRENSLDEHKKTFMINRQKPSNRQMQLQSEMKSKTQQLQDYFRKKNKQLADYSFINQYLQKKNIKFLVNLKNKLNDTVYRSFLDKLHCIYCQQGTMLIPKARKTTYIYILLDGKLNYYDENTSINAKNQLIHAYESSIGSIVGVQSLIPPRFSPYSVIIDSPSMLIKLTQQTFDKYIKQTFFKEQQQITQSLIKTTLFEQISGISLKKYIGGFVEKRFKYKQLIYKQEDPQESIYFIRQGQVQILKHNVNQEEIRVVKVSQNQFLGIQNWDIKINKLHQYSAEVVSNEFRCLCINKQIFKKIMSENFHAFDKMEQYIQKTACLHQQLYLKNNKITQNQQGILSKLRIKNKKKKKKMKRRSETSLEWWGLASKFVSSKKYKMPYPPVSKIPSKQLLNTGIFMENSNFALQIQQFRKKVLEADINSLKQEFKESQKENQSIWKVNQMPMRMKRIKIKMIDTKPKAIDTTQIAKKKLISYAKNQGNFCQRLNLQ